MTAGEITALYSPANPASRWQLHFSSLRRTLLQSLAAWTPILIAFALFMGLIAGINRFASRALPTDPQKRLDSYLAAQMWPDAEKVYQQLLQAKPLDLDLNYGYVTNHFKIVSNKSAARNDQALSDYYQRLASAPATRDIGLLGLGLIQSQQKEYQKALQIYQQAGRTDLKYLNYLMGEAYLKLEQKDLAEKYFQREIEISGDLADAVSNLANLYFEANQADKVQTLIAGEQTAEYLSLGAKRALAFETGDLRSYLYWAFIKLFDNVALEGLLGALLVCGIWVIYFRRIHIFTPAAWMLVPLTILLGAVSAMLTFPIGDIMHKIHPLALGDGALGDLVYSIVQIGLLEEFAKFLPVLLIVALFVKDGEPFDLLYYGSLSALGFATLENVFYFSRFDLGIMVSRFVFSSVLHLSATSIVCYFWAKARYIRKNSVPLAMLLGLLLAALVHGLFDFFLIGPLTQLAVLNPVLLLIMVREYYRMIRNTLNASPHFSQELVRSGRLNNIRLFVLGVLVLLAACFLHAHFSFSTDIANQQLNQLAIVAFPALAAMAAFLGRLALVPGKWIVLFKLPTHHKNMGIGYGMLFAPVLVPVRIGE